MITLDELGYRVAKATLEVFRTDFVGLSNETGLEAIVRVSGVPVGHVRTLLEAFGVNGGLYSRGNLGVTKSILEAIEAHVAMPIERSTPSSSTQNFHVNTGANNQLQFGNEVTGTQSMVTHQHIIQAVEEQIKNSAATPEQKTTALQKLGDLAKKAGVEIVKVAATAVAKHYLGA
jgi:hypothetical protein